MTIATAYLDDTGEHPMNDKPIPPAVAELALEQLVAEPVQPYTCAERTQLLAQIERLTMQLTACGVVALANTPESASKVRDMHPDYMSTSCSDVMQAVDREMQLHAELATLKAQPSGVDERAAFEAWYLGHFYMGDKQCGLEWLSTEPCGGYRHQHPAEQWVVWQARAALSAPSHGEQVWEGWKLVPVEPTDAMLEAGDKYIGTPATYKAMLSACPSPAITKDFSQFLSAVMDAAGLIRHGRQSKELSEYLGMKCMEYRGVAPSAGSQEQGE